jgi:hypothetical protein
MQSKNHANTGLWQRTPACAFFVELEVRPQSPAQTNRYGLLSLHD